MAWTYEASQKGYAKLWDSISIKSTDAANAARFATKIIDGESRYREVGNTMAIPWYFIGALHMRESSCSFAGVLHNGQKIIGTRKKTTLVPKGRGPFATWEASAIDALTMRGLRGITWCPARMGFEAEGFNGTGYEGKENSPYVWAGSNHEQTGKYVADHKFDPSFDDPQIGVMTVIKALANIRPDIAAELAANHVSPAIITKKNVTIAGGVVGGVGTVAATVGDPTSNPVTDTATSAAGTIDQLSPFISMLQNHGTTIALVFTVAVVIGAVAWHFYEKSQTNDTGPR